MCPSCKILPTGGERPPPHPQPQQLSDSSFLSRAIYSLGPQWLDIIWLYGGSPGPPHPGLYLHCAFPQQDHHRKKHHFPFDLLSQPAECEDPAKGYTLINPTLTIDNDQQASFGWTKVLSQWPTQNSRPTEVADIFNISKRQVERIRKRY